MQLCKQTNKNKNHKRLKLYLSKHWRKYSNLLNRPWKHWRTGFFLFFLLTKWVFHYFYTFGRKLEQGTVDIPQFNIFRTVSRKVKYFHSAFKPMGRFGRKKVVHPTVGLKAFAEWWDTIIFPSCPPVLPHDQCNLGSRRCKDIKGTEVSCGQLQRPPDVHNSLVDLDCLEMHLW